MHIVWISALGVGGATVVGALIGFIFKNLSRTFSDLVLSFAAGVMLASSVVGLILPSLSYGGVWALPLSLLGIFVGAWVLVLFDKMTPHLYQLVGLNKEAPSEENRRVRRVLLFVTAIAVHNLPEGIAAGVAFGTGDVAAALSVAGGIALQNIPEGMVVIAPMLSGGISKARTLLIAIFTGVIEVIGTLVGYLAVGISEAILPFALAFAGGAMLFVISDEMIPETHSSEVNRASTFSLLIGFAVMMVVSYFL
jgi:ZIP family zinc transporter